MKPDDLEHDLGADLSRALDAARSDEEARMPAAMRDRLRAELRSERALDRLLDAVPEPEVPADLHQRILTRLALARRAPGRWARWGFGVAAAAMVALGIRIGMNAPAADLTQPEPELLAVLDVLESWEDLTDPDLILGSWEPAEDWLAIPGETNNNPTED